MSTAVKLSWGRDLGLVPDFRILERACRSSVRKDKGLVDSPQYIPGVCNIGPAEIALRKGFGWIGLSFTALLWVLFAFFDVGKFWFALLFFPSAISAVGFIQGMMHFCAAFGLRNLFNVGSELGKTDTVTQAEFRAQDRTKAWRIIAYSALAGLSVTLLAYWLRAAIPFPGPQ